MGRVSVRASAVSGDTATVLLHGAAGSWSTWTPLLRTAQRSREPLRGVVAIDLPGWGESPVPASGLDVAHVSGAVREVAQALGYRRWIVVGHSLGGFVALDIAARWPTETEAVLLISPSGPGVLDAIRRPVRGGIALPGFAGLLLIMRLLAAVGPIGRRWVRVLNEVGMLRALTRPLFGDSSRVHRTVIDALAGEMRPRAFSEAARAAAEYDESVWRIISCPVRSIRGDRDVFVRDSDEVGFATLIGDFEQEALASTGHFAAVEQPDSVLQARRSLTAFGAHASEAGVA